MNELDITPSQRNYLRAIYDLSGGTDQLTVRSVDLVNSLGVSPASVSRAVKLLQKSDIIVRTAQNRIKLTEKGLQTADVIMDRYKLIKIFLTNILKINEAAADIDAWNIEHVISDETVLMMEQIVNKRVLKNILSFTYT